MSGQLFVIGTPIGNLDDITFRAIKTLKTVPVIACENISRTRILLNHFDIHPKKLIECSPANEKNSAKGITQFLEQGQDVALVSDAGTPCISDPGVMVVQCVIQSGFNVIPIPGVSALTTMLSVAGMGGENVIFTGFLSKKESQIIKTLRSYAHKTNVFVIFVSCHRIKKFLKTLKDLEVCVDIIVGKELTKIFEHFFRGSLDDILSNIKEEEKGEFVVVIRFLESLPEKNPLPTFSKKEKRYLKQLKINEDRLG